MTSSSTMRKDPSAPLISRVHLESLLRQGTATGRPYIFAAQFFFHCIFIGILQDIAGPYIQSPSAAALLRTYLRISPYFHTTVLECNSDLSKKYQNQPQSPARCRRPRSNRMGQCISFVRHTSKKHAPSKFLKIESHNAKTQANETSGRRRSANRKRTAKRTAQPSEQQAKQDADLMFAVVQRSLVEHAMAPRIY